jgi:hypothetical protein
MMVTVTILSLISVTFLALLIAGLRGWNSGVSQETATSRVTIAIQKLCNDIRDGQSASASIDGTTLTVTFPQQVTDPDTSETIYDLSASDPATRSYYVYNGNLVRKMGDEVTTIGTGVSAATLRAEGGIVTVTLKSADGTGRSSSTITGRLALRNYRYYHQ